MRHVSHRRRIVKRGSLIGVLAVALVFAVAAPAFAAPAPTEWTVSPSSKTITYGQGAILNGTCTVTADGTAVGGLWVDFGQAITSGGPYTVMYRVTSPTGPYATGQYSIPVMPLQTMYYIFSWEGDATYAASSSDFITVLVKPALGSPQVPSSIKVNKKFTIKGSVKPGAPSGPHVQIKAWKKKANGRWAGYKTYGTKISGTQYSASVKITQTGKYKFKAVSIASAEFASATTGYSRVLTVKK